MEEPWLKEGRSEPTQAERLTFSKAVINRVIHQANFSWSNPDTGLQESCTSPPKPDLDHPDASLVYIATETAKQGKELPTNEHRKLVLDDVMVLMYGNDRKVLQQETVVRLAASLKEVLADKPGTCMAKTDFERHIRNAVEDVGEGNGGFRFFQVSAEGPEQVA